MIDPAYTSISRFLKVSLFMLAWIRLSSKVFSIVSTGKFRPLLIWTGLCRHQPQFCLFCGYAAYALNFDIGTGFISSLSTADNVAALDGGDLDPADIIVLQKAALQAKLTSLQGVSIVGAISRLILALQYCVGAECASHGVYSHSHPTSSPLLRAISTEVFAHYPIHFSLCSGFRYVPWRLFPQQRFRPRRQCRQNCPLVWGHTYGSVLRICSVQNAKHPSISRRVSCRAVY